MDGILGLLFTLYALNKDCSDITKPIEKKFCESLQKHIKDMLKKFTEDELSFILKYLKNRKFDNIDFIINPEMAIEMERQIEDLIDNLPEPENVFEIK